MVLCLAARLHVGHRTVGGVSRTSVFMPKLPHFVATGTWVFMCLNGFKRSESLPAVISRFRDFEPLEHDQNLHRGFSRVPWPPRSQDHEKRLEGGG